MRLIVQCLLLILFNLNLILISISGFSQTKNDSFYDTLSQKMNLYAMKNRAATIYTHFDKNIYTTSEKVWFTTYVLTPPIPYSEYNTFSISLVRNSDKKLIFTEAFALENGIGSGTFSFPDTLSPGAYSFMVFSNVLKNAVPEDIFIQPVTIKLSSMSDIVIRLNMQDKLRSIDTISVKVKVTSSAYKPIANQSISYQFGNTPSTLSGSVKSDDNGEAVINVLKKQVLKDHSLLRVNVKTSYDYKESFLQLPTYEDAYSVKFFPESGSLIENITSVVGVEVKDPIGTPVSSNAYLYEDDQKIGEVSTSENGLGKFILKPLSGKKYHIILQNNNRELTTKYLLPTPMKWGVSLQIQKSLVNDTLDVLVQGNVLNKSYTILLHNYENIYNRYEFTLNKLSKKMRFVLGEVPKGLFEITILDSAGIPLAERIAFAHYDRRLNITMTSSKNIYNTRDSVFVNVKISDQQGNPQKAFFSFSAVSDSRIDPLKYRDLQSVAYLGSYLNTANSVTLYPTSNKNSNPQGLEDLLLVKGWRKYKWQDLLLNNEKTYDPSFGSLRFKATADISGTTPSKNGYNLIVLKDEGFETVSSPEPSVDIPLKLLRTNGKNIFLSLQGKKKENLFFSVTDPFIPVVSNIKKTFSFSGSDYSYDLFRKKQSVVTEMFESVKTLDEVIIKATVRCTRPSQKNACGDYVCKNGALNCPVHIYCGTPAIDGKQYYISFGGSMRMSTYTCFANTKPDGANSISIKGIGMPRVFYGVEYKIDAPDEEVNLTTLFWHNGVVTNDKGEAVIKFMASDLQGKFKCILNGLSTIDNFSQVFNFSVKKND